MPRKPTPETMPDPVETLAEPTLGGEMTGIASSAEHLADGAGLGDDVPEAPDDARLPERRDYPEGQLVDGKFISPSVFFETTWRMLFTLPSTALRLESLQIAEAEMEAAREAAFATWGAIYDTPMLHFLIRPGGKWMERATLIYLFGAPKVAAVRAETQARRQAKSQAGAEAEPVQPSPEPSTGRDSVGNGEVLR